MTSLVDPFALAADVLDPPPTPSTFVKLGYQPNCRVVAAAAEHGETAEPCGQCPQELLHALPPFAHGGPWDLLYGGAAFGGKSWGLLHDAAAYCIRYPGIEVWWVREDYPQLRDSVLGDLERLDYFRKQLGCRWNGTEKNLRFPNGSVMKFRHARNLKDASDMLSAACQLLITCERTTLDPAVFEKLTTRVRSGRPGIPVVGIRTASNPGGPGHSRVKMDFIDPNPLGHQRIPVLNPEGDPVVSKVTGRAMDRLFIPARMSDNPAGLAADPDYETRFGGVSAELSAAYKDGDWSRFEGMRFAAFDPRRHVVRAQDIDLPLGGIRRGLGIDWGSAAPFAAVWGAILNEQLVIYRELYATGLTPTEQARAILAAEEVGERIPQRPIATWLDPACWIRSPDKPVAKPISPDAPPPGSIAHGYRAAGVPVEKAYNDRISGFVLIDELLGNLPDGRPRTVFSDACPNVIRSVSGAPRDPRNPEDVDPAYKDDHALDGFRYEACGMMRGTMRRRPGRHDRRSAGVRGATSGLARAKS